MVNYYKVLKVSPKASNAEIKSAYRRLARKLHPDVNGNSQKNSVDFADIAKAYEILGNPKQRADYDQQVLRAEYNITNGDSVFSSDNAHARRWRQMAYERRYNEIIDRMLADERRETAALQRVIFPTVVLFLSTCVVAIFKPRFWDELNVVGQILLVSLFIVGTIHLINRFRLAFERYTYSDERLHDSIFNEIEPETKPFTRLKAVSFLIIGIGLSLGVGLFIGIYFSDSIYNALPSIVADNKYWILGYSPQLVFYPPIAVLLVDVMHSIISKFDY